MNKQTANELSDDQLDAVVGGMGHSGNGYGYGGDHNHHGGHDHDRGHDHDHGLGHDHGHNHGYPHGGGRGGYHPY